MQTHLQSARQHLYQIYWSLWTLLSWKKSLLVLCKILRLFVNKLTTDGKYSLLNRDDFTQPIQILVSHKKKTFSWFFSAFLKSTLNFEHFQKKHDPDRRSIYRFRGPFDKQHGKRVQTYLQFRRQHLDQIYWSW